jgi:multiple sugar transport system substrate-binding protein
MIDIIKQSTMSRRSFLTRSALTLGAAASANTLLAACGSSTSTSGGTTTLTVMYTSSEFTSAYISEFEKLNPGIKINFVALDQTHLTAMLASGNPPDFVEGTGVTDLPNLAARGLALNLDPYLAKSTVLKKSDLQPINDVWRFDGKVEGQGSYYGIVKDYSQDSTIWFNKKLFDQAKVPYPSETEPLTYDQVLEIGRKLTVRQGGKTQVFGFDALWANPSVTSPSLMQMIQQQGSTLFSMDLTTADFTAPEALKALQWYVDYAQAHVGSSPLDPNPDGWDGPLFLADRVAITYAGFWFGGEIATDTHGLADHVGFAPALQMGSQRLSSCFGAVGSWIPAASKNPDAAWKVMEYFHGGKPAQDRAQGGWGLPALASLVSEVPRSKPYQAQAFQTQQQEAPYFGLLHMSPYITVDALFASVSKYLQQAMNGQLTVAAAARQMTDDVNAQLQRGKQQVG